MVYTTKNGDRTIGEPKEIIEIATNKEHPFRKIRRWNEGLYKNAVRTKKYIAVIYEIEGEDYE